MNQQAKIWDQAANRAGEHYLDTQMAARRDGIVTEEEQRLIDGARDVYLLAEETAKRQRIAQRLAGGGNLDKNLLRDWQEFEELKEIA